MRNFLNNIRCIFHCVGVSCKKMKKDCSQIKWDHPILKWMLVFLIVQTGFGSQSWASEGYKKPESTLYASSSITPSVAIMKYTNLTSPAPKTIYDFRVMYLADTFNGDPEGINTYVQRNIELVPHFGLSKGGAGALLDMSGTPFDQAQLMVDAIRYKGGEARYQLVTATLTMPQAMAWLKAQDASQVETILDAGGIPNTVSGNAISILHVLVEAKKANQPWRLYDPSALFNKYTPPSYNFDILSGFNGSNFMQQTLSGAIINNQPTYSSVENVNDVNVYNYMKGMTGAVVAKMDATSTTVNAPYSMDTVLGYWRADIGSELTAASPFSVGQIHATWNGDIPDIFRTKITISNIYNSLDVSFYADEYYTTRVTLKWEPEGGNTFIDTVVEGITTTLQPPDGYRLKIYAGHLSLPDIDPWFYGRTGRTSYLLAQGDLMLDYGGEDITIAVNHPYAAQNMGYMDEVKEFQTSSERISDVVLALGGFSQSHSDKYDALVKSDTQRYDAEIGERCVYEPTWNGNGLETTCTDDRDIPYRAFHRNYFTLLPQDMDIAWRQWAAKVSEIEAIASGLRGVSFDMHHRIGLSEAEGRRNSELDGASPILHGIVLLQTSDAYVVGAKSNQAPADERPLFQALNIFKDQIHAGNQRQIKYNTQTPRNVLPNPYPITSGKRKRDVDHKNFGGRFSSSDFFYTQNKIIQLTDPAFPDAVLNNYSTNIIEQIRTEVTQGNKVVLGGHNSNGGYATIGGKANICETYSSQGGFSGFSADASIRTAPVSGPHDPIFAISASGRSLSQRILTEQIGNTNQNTAGQKASSTGGGGTATIPGGSGGNREPVISTPEISQEQRPLFSGNLSSSSYTINPLSGSLEYNSANDLSIGNGTLFFESLQFNRQYSSDGSNVDAGLGRGWSHNFEQSIKKMSGYNAQFSRIQLKTSAFTLSALRAAETALAADSVEGIVSAHIAVAIWSRASLDSVLAVKSGGSTSYYGCKVGGDYYPLSGAPISKIVYNQLQDQLVFTGLDKTVSIYQQLRPTDYDFDDDKRAFPSRFNNRYYAQSFRNVVNDLVTFTYNTRTGNLESVSNSRGRNINLEWGTPQLCDAFNQQNDTPSWLSFVAPVTHNSAGYPVVLYEQGLADACYYVEQCVSRLISVETNGLTTAFSEEDNCGIENFNFDASFTGAYRASSNQPISEVRRYTSHSGTTPTIVESYDYGAATLANIQSGNCAREDHIANKKLDHILVGNGSPNGSSLEFKYQKGYCGAYGSVNKVIDADGTTILYFSPDQYNRIVDSLGNTVERYYDKLKHLIEIIEPSYEGDAP